MIRKSILSILLCLLLLTLCGCGSEAPDTVVSIDQLDAPGYTVGAAPGKNSYTDVEEAFTEAEIMAFSGLTNGILAVRNGVIHGYADSENVIEVAMASGSLEGLTMLDGYIGKETDIVAGISRKSAFPDLKNRIDAFLAEIKADGTMEDVYRRWIKEGLYELPEIHRPENPTGRLVVGTTGLTTPFSFYMGDTLTGMDIELIYRLADYLNAELVIKTYDFYGIITALETGMCDCVFSNLNASPEREEAMLFSAPIYTTRTRILVRDASAVSGEKFFPRLLASFEKTFLREARWKMVLQGIGVTTVISLASGLLGTILGFGLCMLRRRKRSLIRPLTTVYIRIMQGTPIVVLLMILYYIVFAKSGLSGLWVAIIAFALNFAAYSSEIFRSGIDSVDIGQTEAALALGYTGYQAFMGIVLPQAARQFLPVYRGEFISMVKMTSIVGYIAVQDLTKMSDIIRSRTYEAFFPLIATALIYFLLSYLLTALLSASENSIGSSRKERTVKGVVMK